MAAKAKTTKKAAAKKPAPKKAGATKAAPVKAPTKKAAAKKPAAKKPAAKKAAAKKPAARAATKPTAQTDATPPRHRAAREQTAALAPIKLPEAPRTGVSRPRSKLLK